MIATEQTVRVARGIAPTWDYARDFDRWAGIMPGFQSCESENADTSRWVLKVGVGALVRTVKVRVHVERWAGPAEVDFSFALEGDPVTGSGTYRAMTAGPDETDIALQVEVRGTGPMAPMWEAMGGPVLPRFARSFAEQLRDRIEAAVPPPAAPPPQIAVPTPPPSVLAMLAAWVRHACEMIFHRKDTP